MPLKKVLFLMTIITAMTVRADYETFNIFGSIAGGFGLGGVRDSSRVVENGITTSVTDQFFNYGSGFKIDLGCQYFMMEDVALQASFSLSMGGRFKISDEVGDSHTTTTYKRRLYGIKVGVVPRFEALDLIDVYTGVGIGFYWNSRPFEKVFENPQGTQESKGKITSSPTFGFHGLLGMDYPLTDQFTLFGEIGFELMRFNLKKYIIKETNITTEEPGTTFYNKDDTDSDNLAPEKVPGSNFQIRIGIRYAIF